MLSTQITAFKKHCRHQSQNAAREQNHLQRNENLFYKRNLLYFGINSCFSLYK